MIYRLHLLPIPRHLSTVQYLCVRLVDEESKSEQGLEGFPFDNLL